MGRDDRSPDEEWFTLDARGRPEEPEDAGRRRRGPSVLTVLLALVVLTLAGIAWANRSRDEPVSRPTPTTALPSTAGGTSGPAPTAPGSSSPPTPTRPPSPSPTVTTSRLARPPFGATPPWDLLILRAGALERVEMASGRVTTTTLAVSPDPNTAYTVVPFRGRALVTPLRGEHVPAYVVEDDGSQRPSPLPPGVAVGVPGTERLWVMPIDWSEAGRVAQRTLDGRPVAGPVLTVPEDVFLGEVRSDGSDGLLVESVDGTYRLTQSGLRRVTTGTVLGVTAGGWLVNECDADHRCGLAFVEAGTWHRRPLGPALAHPAAGSIDPTGRRAVVVDGGPEGSLVLLLDLRNGARRSLGPRSPVDSGLIGVVWSPDGRWCVLAFDLDVVGLDTETLRVASVLPGGGLVRAVGARAGSPGPGGPAQP